MYKYFKDVDDMLKYFPKNLNGETILSYEDEFYEFMFRRLIASFIPYKLPTTDSLKLQRFFVKEIYKRTGLRLEISNPFINYLVLKTKDFHIKRSKRLNLKNVEVCSNCKVNFKEGHIGVNTDNRADILNPGTYFSNSDKLNHYEIDHIEPISKLGTNNEKNLQVLCTICNSGKSDIAIQFDRFNTISERVYIEKIEEFIKQEIEYTGSSLENKITFFPLSLFYRVINRDKNCKFCNGLNNASLTVMPINREFLYTIDNLVTVCYSCLEKYDTIPDMRWIEL